MAKRLLSQKGQEFEQIDVSNDPQTRGWLRQFTGRHTVPQIVINGKPVGGFDDIAALDRAGQLDRLLAEDWVGEK
jgi:glutaredoxin 3